MLLIFVRKQDSLLNMKSLKPLRKFMQEYFSYGGREETFPKQLVLVSSR